MSEHKPEETSQQSEIWLSPVVQTLPYKSVTRTGGNRGSADPSRKWAMVGSRQMERPNWSLQAWMSNSTSRPKPHIHSSGLASSLPRAVPKGSWSGFFWVFFMEFFQQVVDAFCLFPYVIFRPVSFPIYWTDTKWRWEKVY